MMLRVPQSRLPVRERELADPNGGLFSSSKTEEAVTAVSSGVAALPRSKKKLLLWLVVLH